MTDQETAPNSPEVFSTPLGSPTLNTTNPEVTAEATKSADHQPDVATATMSGHDIGKPSTPTAESTSPTVNADRHDDAPVDASLSSPEPAHSEKTLAADDPSEPVGSTNQRTFADWKWKGVIASAFVTSMINGYDVSNVANIQPRLYEALGEIEVLPWIGLSYSLSFFAVLSLARKIIYCFNMKWVYLSSLVIFIAGAAIAGAAPNMSAVIVGRVIMGIGGSMVQQSNMSFLAVFATPAETPGLFGVMSACWAIGLVIGGPIGSAFAEDSSATWRWAFYFNIPLVGLSFVLAAICLPMHNLSPASPLWHRLMKIDPVGIILNISSPVLFAVALTFSGPIWEWGSTPSNVVWAVFGVVTVAWILQQTFCILTTPEERALPLHILKRLDLMPLWIATGAAGSSYAITLYYTPLYFAFAQGDDAMQQTVKLLPFVLVFIVSVLLTGGILLPVLGRYNIIFTLAGVFTLAGGAAMAATLSDTVSENVVLGLEALIGIGLGMHFQHGIGISNVINKTDRDRVDSVVIFNLAQMGGIAISLAVAGAIFQNVGFDLLRDALGNDTSYTDNDIREALAGVASPIFNSSNPELLERSLSAVADILSREFWIVASGGALTLICGLFMKWEKLDYGRKKKNDAKMAP